MDAGTVGMLLIFLGAVCGGCFGLPSKFVSKDTPWETLWGPFFVFVTILIPTAIFPFIAEGLFATCAHVGLMGLLPILIFGFLWGLGSMALGMSFAFIGLSLAYAINYGAQIACGGIGPMAVHSPEQIPTPHGCIILGGVVVCIVGVAVCGRAALLREASQKKDDEPESGEQQKPQMMKGILVAFISGVLCACYAMAASFGGPVQTASETQFGNESWRAAFAVTAVILWGGALSACGACVFKMAKNKTWGSLAKPGIGRVLVVAFIMALLHDGAILFFIIGASNLGKLGVAVGYAVFMSFAIIVGNVNGFLTGEWKGASKGSIAWLGVGILVLVLGVSTLKYGDFVQIKADEAAKAKVVKELPVSPEAETPTKPE